MYTNKQKELFIFQKKMSVVGKKKTTVVHFHSSNYFSGSSYQVLTEVIKLAKIKAQRKR